MQSTHKCSFSSPRSVRTYEPVTLDVLALHHHIKDLHIEKQKCGKLCELNFPVVIMNLALKRRMGAITALKNARLCMVLSGIINRVEFIKVNTQQILRNHFVCIHNHVCKISAQEKERKKKLFKLKAFDITMSTYIS